MILCGIEPQILSQPEQDHKIENVHVASFHFIKLLWLGTPAEEDSNLLLFQFSRFLSSFVQSPTLTVVSYRKELTHVADYKRYKP